MTDTERKAISNELREYINNKLKIAGVAYTEKEFEDFLLGNLQLYKQIDDQDKYVDFLQDSLRLKDFSRYQFVYFEDLAIKRIRDKVIAGTPLAEEIELESRNASRITSVLKRKGIKTFADLLSYTQEEFGSFQNLGRKSCNELEDYLFSHDFRFLTNKDKKILRQQGVRSLDILMCCSKSAFENLEISQELKDKILSCGLIQGKENVESQESKSQKDIQDKKYTYMGLGTEIFNEIIADAKNRHCSSNAYTQMTEYLNKKGKNIFELQKEYEEKKISYKSKNILPEVTEDDILTAISSDWESLKYLEPDFAKVNFFKLLSAINSEEEENIYKKLDSFYALLSVAKESEM